MPLKSKALLSGAAALACIVSGIATGRAQSSSAPASLPEPAGWLDLPGAPFVKRLAKSDGKVRWELVNRSSSSFDNVVTGCVVERDGKAHIVAELIAVSISDASP